MVAVLAIVAVLGGLVLGPGQIVWCLFLSGDQAAAYDIRADQEVVVALAPEQNPVRFLAKMEYVEPFRHFGTAVTSFDGVLRRGDEELWSSRFRVSHDDDEEETGIRIGSSYTNTSVKLFTVEEAGDYTFVAKSTDQNEIEVRSISLRVRQNVSEVHTVTAVVGFALLALAAVLLVVVVRSSRRNAEVEPA